MNERFKATIREIRPAEVADIPIRYRIYLESSETVIVLKGAFKSKAIAKAELDYFCTANDIERTSRIIYKTTDSYSIVVVDSVAN